MFDEELEDDWLADCAFDDEELWLFDDDDDVRVPEPVDEAVWLDDEDWLLEDDDDEDDDEELLLELDLRVGGIAVVVFIPPAKITKFSVKLLKNNLILVCFKIIFTT